MTILLLEDRGSRLLEMQQLLEDWDHEVLPCHNVCKAMDTWEDNAGHIDCVIVDLAMKTTGLSDQGVEDSQSGYYTGWVFLREFISEKAPAFAKRCLVFSAWSDSFKLYLKKFSGQQWAGFADAQILSKNDQDWEKKLRRELNRIAKLSREVRR